MTLAGPNRPVAWKINMEKQLLALAIIGAAIFGTLFCAFLFFRVRDKVQARRKGRVSVVSAPEVSIESKEVSRYFPNKFFSGAAIIQDQFLKWTMADGLFRAPQRSLIVKGFRYFSIGDNDFEEILFTQTNREDYRAIYSVVDNCFFLLQRFMKTGASGHVPRMIRCDTIALAQGPEDSPFTDVTGLVEVDLKDTNDNHLKFRLLRVYSRPLGNTVEYLFCLMDDVGVVSYFIGPKLKPEQLSSPA